MPVSRRELIRRLRRLGFDGPYAGTKLQVMFGRGRAVRLPNPHGSQDISDGLLARIVREAGVTRQEWDNAK
jgi:predicted RNA binding protein YcfA (HicA-like mRNA interferase family)